MTAYGSTGRQESVGEQECLILRGLRFWVKLGFINFGGPAGQIAIMHRELVGMGLISFVALYKFKAEVLWVVLAGGLIGLVKTLLL